MAERDENKLKESVDEKQTRLLETMIKRQERDIRINRITAWAECLLLTVLIIVFAVLVPRFLKTVQRVDRTMEEVDVLLGQAQEAMSEMVDLARDMDEVVQENDEAISEAIANFNSVDFDSLNTSISNIANFLEPVVELVTGILR